DRLVLAEESAVVAGVIAVGRSGGGDREVSDTGREAGLDDPLGAAHLDLLELLLAHAAGWLDDRSEVDDRVNAMLGEQRSEVDGPQILGEVVDTLDRR